MSDDFDTNVVSLIEQLQPIVEGAADRSAAACALGAALAAVLRTAKPPAVRDWLLEQVIDALRKDVRRV